MSYYTYLDELGDDVITGRVPISRFTRDFMTEKVFIPTNESPTTGEPTEVMIDHEGISYQVVCSSQAAADQLPDPVTKVNEVDGDDVFRLVREGVGILFQMYDEQLFFDPETVQEIIHTYDIFNVHKTIDSTRDQ
ncbi:MAG: hypothetical protein FWG08_06475 [Propionibacteriaceae bacterium]|jgi:hypothetical protein|nr:hypothetical protein [Propionibacteriaceae bacterium]